jgi:hypothetical protein
MTQTPHGFAYDLQGLFKSAVGYSLDAGLKATPDTPSEAGRPLLMLYSYLTPPVLYA